MSLNELYDNNVKPWMNVSLNSIKIDGELNYANSTKANGDNLVLDAGLVARWVPLPTATVYGNEISVRPAASTLTITPIHVPFNVVDTFSTIYTFNNNSDTITINRDGVYFFYATLAFAEVNNLQSMTFTVGGSNITATTSKTFPSVLAVNDSGTQSAALSCTFIKAATAGTTFKLLASSSSVSTIIPSCSCAGIFALSTTIPP